MNILLVEDEIPKKEHIKSFIATLFKEIECEYSIDVVCSVNSALDWIEESIPDLLILDMSLPTFDINLEKKEFGGNPQGFGGIEVLKNLKIDKIICKTLIITGYEAFSKKDSKPIDINTIKSDLLMKYPEYIIDVLHFNSTYDTWKVKLKSSIEELIK
ncbi:response regulator [Acinetobacter sp. 12966]|uniref:response regulator n=1 Tax=Acinetobacter sp. 12966 TaxID=3058488 RepID=UPI00234104A5|nr:response regulator [Acinetobacter sp. 12966]MDC5626366.1 response regulator [Acinetobacter baumannii]MDQ9948387.1 response regulator [Acinetobacter sp. 12966]